MGYYVLLLGRDIDDADSSRTWMNEHHTDHQDIFFLAFYHQPTYLTPSK